MTKLVFRTLLVILGLFIILRLPSLFEPHWYGDEGIYASVAYAMENGKKLYVDIFDNKPPGIYYIYSLATADNRLMMMKLFNLVAGLVTVIGIYAVGTKLKLKNSIIVALLIVLIFLGTPLIEGNIANAENFFLPITIWGIWWGLSRRPRESLIAGTLFGLAFLIKFPTVFTFAAVGAYLLFSERSIKEAFTKVVPYMGGFFAVVLGAFGLLTLNGTAQSAIEYGFLNNGGYVTFYENEVLIQIIKAVVLVGAVISTIIAYRLQKLSREWFFVILLGVFDAYAALFSGRQYEHYLLQFVPSVALGTALMVSYIFGKNNPMKKGAVFLSSLLFIAVIIVVFYNGSEKAVRMNIYEYYKEFTLATAKIHYEPRLPFSFYREPAKLKIYDLSIKKYKTDSIYYYSDVPWVYDYLHVVPSTFFVTQYHQFMIPDGKKRIAQDLDSTPVKLIVVDKNTEVSPELQIILNSSYQKDFEDSYFLYFVPKSFVEET